MFDVLIIWLQIVWCPFHDIRLEPSLSADTNMYLDWFKIPVLWIIPAEIFFIVHNYKHWTIIGLKITLMTYK